MPKQNDVGYSEYTKIKQKHFRIFLDTHIRIITCILKKCDFAEQAYHYIDCTAGPGMVDGMLGSPLIFTEKIQRTELPFIAYFIEQNKENHQDLVLRLHPKMDLENSHMIPLWGRSEDFLPSIALTLNSIRGAKYGLIYCDPSGNIPPFDMLGNISIQKSFRYMDFLINCNCAVIKRVLKSPKHQENRRLADYLAEIRKRYWLIREPYFKQQWTFLCGTNWADFPEFEKIGFYRADKPKGREILDILNSTLGERNGKSLRGKKAESSKDGRGVDEVHPHRSRAA